MKSCTGIFMLLIALYVVILGIGAFIFLIAYNFVMPSVFNWPTLDYVQALFLWILIGITVSLFRSSVTINK